MKTRLKIAFAEVLPSSPRELTGDCIDHCGFRVLLRDKCEPVKGSSTEQARGAKGKALGDPIILTTDRAAEWSRDTTAEDSGGIGCRCGQAWCGQSQPLC